MCVLDLGFWEVLLGFGHMHKDELIISGSLQ